jgi:phosphohistidine phosphatase SixA
MQSEAYYSVYLILMRHAVSTWQTSSDFERPLAANTSSSIHSVTQQLYDFFSHQKQEIELQNLNLLCVSPAIRTQSTYQEVQAYLSTLKSQWQTTHIDCQKDLYLASADTLIQRLYILDEFLSPSHSIIPPPSLTQPLKDSSMNNHQSHTTMNQSIPIGLMMIAHNPGLSDLIHQLSGHMIRLQEAEAVVLYTQLPHLRDATLSHWELLTYVKP